MNEGVTLTMLERASRFVLACLIATQICGCTSYKPGVFPSYDSKQEPHEKPVEIRVGAEVQIEMTNGEKCSGEVIRFSETELTFGMTGNYGLEERTIDRANIAHIEVRKESGAATVAATTVGVLVIVFVALGVLAVVTGGVNMSSN